MRFQRYGMWRPRKKVLPDVELERGRQLKALGLSTVELAAHFGVGVATVKRLFRDEPQRKREIKP